MFSLFKAPTFTDPTLGELRRSGGAWRGTIALDTGRAAPLVVAGSRSAPDASALAIARTLRADYPSWRPAIERALFEHLAPYAEAVAAGEADPPTGGMPRITTPAEVWSHVGVEHVSVLPLDGAPTVEIGYRTVWDEEHLLGARLRGGQLLELNGSVRPP